MLGYPIYDRQDCMPFVNFRMGHYYTDHPLAKR